MHVRVKTKANANDGFDAMTPLPLHQNTNVRVEAIGRYFALYLNNTIDNYVILSADRFSGPATLKVCNTWNHPAKASIGPIQMTPIGPVQIPPFFDRLGGYNESTTNVPGNYKLSFSIRPSRTVPHWSSIIHYSGDKTDTGPRGRMPGIFFHKLLIGFSNLVVST